MFNAVAINNNMAETIGQKIEKLRKAQKLSRRELAERIISKFGGASVEGMSQYIYQLEKGKRKPKVETLNKIAAVLNVPPSYFFEDQSQKEFEYLGKSDGYVKLPIYGEVGAGDMIVPVSEGDFYAVPLAGRAKPKKDWFVLKVKGKSMEPYIHDGSFLVVEPAQFGYAESGQIVVLCEEDGDYLHGCTVKKIKDAGDKWLVIPLNESFEAYTVDKNRAKIKGIVRKVIWEP
ncbi:SOS-response transcriptional repressor LexA (RecA-mediated autopeptidase) [Balnearium lithotrophicum]|uniref:SOS-response transcriptional repressor LexA (RecA-mediated autopeptidase) n=1 Tax=Balnearium lithotrophicum TaxID=223788 RepID=A0A521CQJ2_9BACT|nr:S24 family peptidase [Balnearium lithotrophicum]SMO61727.1 SOS-response transcriptional repressor LexA (RecA-mediated autopeptidase) [Balnearium lithotrophicum]